MTSNTEKKMVGLDDKTIKSLNYDQAVKRILTDSNTDFIFAPLLVHTYTTAWDIDFS